jgi:hypothetical protein
MRFRFRYSLLTLLILTALVAGGVKLWYGPHHVVERLRPDVEIEYSYTRNWDGSRMIHGIHVQREFVEAKSSSTAIHYYQQGKAKARGCGIEQSLRTYNKAGLQFIYDAFLDCQEHERRAWIQAIDREREKFGSSWHEINVFNPR